MAAPRESPRTLEPLDARQGFDADGNGFASSSVSRAVRAALLGFIVLLLSGCAAPAAVPEATTSPSPSLPSALPSIATPAPSPSSPPPAQDAPCVPRGVVQDVAAAPYLASAPPGEVAVIAGAARRLPDEAAALEVDLAAPFALAALPDGSALVVDVSGDVVWRLTPEGRMTRFAGVGSAEALSRGGSTLGDEGPASEALLRFPRDVSVAPDGSVLVADTNHYLVRRVTPDGTMHRVAGSRDFRFSGDGGPAVAAGLGYPVAAAQDAQGRVLILDAGENNPDDDAGTRIRRVELDGTITTIAGGRRGEMANVSGPSSLRGLVALRASPTGEVLARFQAPDDPALHRFDPDNGTFTPVPGTERVHEFTFAPDGDVVLIDRNASLVRVEAGVRTILVPYLREVRDPRGLAVLPDGSILIADADAHVVRRVDAAGRLGVVAGTGEDGRVRDGPAADARIQDTQGLAYDAAGNLYFTDFQSNLLRRVTTSGLVETVAGTGRQGWSGDGGHPLSATFSQPRAIAFDSAGRLFFIDETHGQGVVRMISPGADGLVDGSPDECIVTVAGQITAERSTDAGAADGGPALRARFLGLRGLAVADDDALILVDWLDARVRRVDPGEDGLVTGATDETITSLSRPGWLEEPNWAAVSVDGVVLLHDKGRVVRLGDEGAVLVATAPNLLSFAALPDGRVAWVDGTSVHVLDATGASLRVAGGEAGDALGAPASARFRGLGFFAPTPDGGGLVGLDGGSGQLRVVPLPS